MEYSYKYFENRACEYFPCHEGLECFNCLFCYCPFYLLEKCPGCPTFIKTPDKVIKDCSQCSFPHQPENYDMIVQLISKCNDFSKNNIV